MARRVMPGSLVDAATVGQLLGAVFGNEKLGSYDPLRLAGDKQVAVQTTPDASFDYIFPREKNGNPEIVIPTKRGPWQIAQESSRGSVAANLTEACLVLGERALARASHPDIQVPDLVPAKHYIARAFGAVEAIAPGIAAALREGRDFRAERRYHGLVKEFVHRGNLVESRAEEQEYADALFQTVSLAAGRFIETARRHLPTYE